MEESNQKIEDGSTLRKVAQLEKWVYVFGIVFCFLAGFGLGWVLSPPSWSQPPAVVLPTAGTASMAALNTGAVYRVSARTPLMPVDEWIVGPPYLEPGDLVYVAHAFTGRKRYLVSVMDDGARYQAWVYAEDLEGQTLEEVPP